MTLAMGSIAGLLVLFYAFRTMTQGVGHQADDFHFYCRQQA
ncbi:MAG TPA: hypothetical protein VGL81_29370 [Polyangiaceae bacterium]|jgi:hypothetical protein